MKEYGLYDSGMVIRELIVGDKAWAFVSFDDAVEKLQDLEII